MPRTFRYRNVLFPVFVVLVLPIVSIAPDIRAALGDETIAEASARLFDKDNLIAWCIVPFDSKKRDPEARAQMLGRLGFRRFAYDWRAEHIPAFDAELEALKRHNISLDAFWVAPGELNRESKIILNALKRHQVKTCLWVLLDLGPERVVSAEEGRKRVDRAVEKLKPLAEAAHEIGCTLALYNHEAWFGEPENQLAILDELKRQGVTDVGIVYNLHHGHEHLDRLAAVLKMLKPHLVAINLNGMDRAGVKQGRQILPIGQGERDLDVLKTIAASGYRGPIGILGHTNDDAEVRLQDNLDGLTWLKALLKGEPAGPRPKPRTPVPPRDPTAFDADRVAEIVALAKTHGDPKRGAEIFLAAKNACSSCHKFGEIGGAVGPDLSKLSQKLAPEAIVESILWPRRQIAEGYAAIAVATVDGKVIQGYRQSETATELVLREATGGARLTIPKKDVEQVKEIGTLMPDGLIDALDAEERQDLARFLIDLGKTDDSTKYLKGGHHHAPASFTYDRAPLQPESWPHWREFVNRDRIYDFYAKEADFFMSRSEIPSILPQFPGLDGGKDGHWGNQNEATWADGRWNDTLLDSVQCGVFRGNGVVVPKGVCVRLGASGGLSVCFNPETLCYEALWRDGFVKFSPVRHGFLEGVIMAGTPLSKPACEKPEKAFVYHGFYRHGDRVIFSYRVGDVEMLDSPSVEDGRFVRIVGPAKTHPLASLTRGGPARRPNTIETRGKLGQTRPYAFDTVEPPFQNPWKALFFFGGHDFLPDGTAFLCTIEGDVWRVEGLDQTLDHVKWRCVATGLHQALGLVVADGLPHVLGRDQITRLHDLNGDGEFDFYECVSNSYVTSTAGHDFICGLERDSHGDFYTSSGRQGLLRISGDGRKTEVLATGFRNADGLGLLPDGTLTVPCSEGEWTPSSMICEVKPGAGGYYGYGGPKNGQAPDLPLVYLPRGLDNSSGGQTVVSGERWGPLQGQLLHFSNGAGALFMILRETIDGQAQGAVVPLPGEFLSGSHRGRFNPKDGQLYVSGADGWGSYVVADGSFQRVRYTGDPVQLPIAFHVHQNGIRVTFSSPLDRSQVEKTSNFLAQAWNYRYGANYGSPELSPSHPGLPGHDVWPIRSAHLLVDGKTLFLEIPRIQPVNQLHLRFKIDAGLGQDLFVTAHKLGAPYTDFPGYRPIDKTIAVHPILTDLALATKSQANPWRYSIPNSRKIVIQAGKNLTFATQAFSVRPGEPIKLIFHNPDVVPHNWVLVKPDSLSKVGTAGDKLIADPEAVARNYVPRLDEVIVHTDIVPPGDQFSISFFAPKEPGRYPYLCTFPGHWMVMNGVMTVEKEKARQ